MSQETMSNPQQEQQPKMETVAHEYAINHCNGWTMYIPMLEDAFKAGNRYCSKHSYSEQEVIGMLEALRQRCADASKNRELSPNAHSNRIEAIDVHQFIPPKQ